MFSFCRALWKSVCLATSERFLLEDLDNLIKYQPKVLSFMRAQTIWKFGINMLNNAKKIVKELTSKLPKVKTAFSGLITRDKKNLDRNVAETNKRLKNYCCQKDIGYIDNSNTTEVVRNKETTFKSQRSQIFCK